MALSPSARLDPVVSLASSAMWNSAGMSAVSRGATDQSANRVGGKSRMQVLKDFVVSAPATERQVAGAYKKVAFIGSRQN
jgi:hypothetical protein